MPLSVSCLWSYTLRNGHPPVHIWKYGSLGGPSQSSGFVHSACVSHGMWWWPNTSLIHPLDWASSDPCMENMVDSGPLGVWPAWLDFWIDQLYSRCSERLGPRSRLVEIFSCLALAHQIYIGEQIYHQIFLSEEIYHQIFLSEEIYHQIYIWIVFNKKHTVHNQDKLWNIVHTVWFQNIGLQ